MDDRTLLELAARAAGLGDGRYDDDYGSGLQIDDSSLPIGYRWWNPLTDDGDALRLAVRLEIDVYGSHATRYAETNEGAITEPVDDDPYAATRRAIVRAAAEIGKGIDAADAA